MLVTAFAAPPQGQQLSSVGRQAALASTRSTLPPALREGNPFSGPHCSKSANRVKWLRTKLKLASAGQGSCGAVSSQGVLGPALAAPPASVQSSVAVRDCSSCSCRDRGCCNNGSKATRRGTSAEAEGVGAAIATAAAGVVQVQGSPSFLPRRGQRRSGGLWRAVGASSPAIAVHRGEEARIQGEAARRQTSALIPGLPLSASVMNALIGGPQLTLIGGPPDHAKNRCF